MKKTKTKYEKQVKPKLALITAWARDGLIDKDIAAKLGIGYSTLSLYRGQHPELEKALENGKEVADVEVENALFKRSVGYSYDEVTEEYGAETKRVRKHLAPDTTAQIFWLKNRKPAVWRDKQEVEHSGEMGLGSEKLSAILEQLKDDDG